MAPKHSSTKDDIWRHAWLRCWAPGARRKRGYFSFFHLTDFCPLALSDFAEIWNISFLPHKLVHINFSARSAHPLGPWSPKRANFGHFFRLFKTENGFWMGKSWPTNMVHSSKWCPNTPLQKMIYGVTLDCAGGPQEPGEKGATFHFFTSQSWMVLHVISCHISIIWCIKQQNLQRLYNCLIACNWTTWH